MEATTATLTLGTLHIFSNELADNFDQQLRVAVEDCRQRPSHSDKRTVTIQLEITPDEDDPEDVMIASATKLSIPSRKIVATKARRTRGDQLQFDFCDVGSDDEAEE